MIINALILARGGSKGVPRKNIKPLLGKPLLGYVLNETQKCTFLDDICVSSEDEEILDYAAGEGVSIQERPVELASDTARSIEAAKYYLQFNACDYLMLLNACCPLTLASDICRAVKLALETGVDSVVSLVEDFSCHPSKICQLDDDKILPLGSFEAGQRQKLGRVFKRNCAIYLAKSAVIESGSFFGKDTRGYVMPKERSWDINDQLDWAIAEFLMQKYLTDN